MLLLWVVMQAGFSAKKRDRWPEVRDMSRSLAFLLYTQLQEKLPNESRNIRSALQHLRHFETFRVLDDDEIQSWAEKLRIELNGVRRTPPFTCKLTRHCCRQEAWKWAEYPIWHRTAKLWGAFRCSNFKERSTGCDPIWHCASAMHEQYRRGRWSMWRREHRCNTSW